jgi:hypothetical protein
MLLPMGLALIGFLLIAIGARDPRKAAPVTRRRKPQESAPEPAKPAQARPKLVASNPDASCSRRSPAC